MAAPLASFRDFPDQYLQEKKKFINFLYSTDDIKIDKNGCHQWEKACSGRKRCRRILKRGYGVMKLTCGGKSRTVLVHKLVYYLHNGRECTPGEDISHLCHKTDCVNPAHLNLEPHLVNMQRTVCKDQRFCTKHGVHPDCIFQ